MLEAVGDIWTERQSGVVVITSNGSLTRDGRAVLGRGVARQAQAYFPDLAEILGRHLAAGGNHVHDLGSGLVSFPVEDTAWSQPDLRLIGRSAREIQELADLRGWRRIFVPRPACGGGGLAWSQVKPLLVPWFDDRFTVITSAGPD